MSNISTPRNLSKAVDKLLQSSSEELLLFFELMHKELLAFSEPYFLATRKGVLPCQQ